MQVDCPNCRTANEPGLQFCTECGTPLSAICRLCGFANRPGARFCGSCGQQITLNMQNEIAGSRIILFTNEKLQSR